MTGIIQKKIGILQTAIILRSQQSIPYITEPSTMFQDKMYYYAWIASFSHRAKNNNGNRTANKFFSAHRLENYSSAQNYPVPTNSE